MPQVALLLAILLCSAIDGSADIYRCPSEDGSIRFSDHPCAPDAQLVVRELLPSVDEAVSVKIHHSSRNPTLDPYKTYLLNETKRISRSILPDKFFNGAEVIRVVHRDPSSIPKVFDRPEPRYGNTPGWVVRLHYGLANKPRVWELQYQFKHDVTTDISGIWKTVVRLHTIKIRRNGAPFTPDTMRTSTKMKPTQPGEWERLW